MLIISRVCTWLESPPPAQEGDTGRTDDFVEHAGCPHEQRESDDLEPFKGLPAESQTHNPNEERSTGVDSAS